MRHEQPINPTSRNHVGVLQDSAVQWHVPPRDPGATFSSRGLPETLSAIGVSLRSPIAALFRVIPSARLRHPSRENCSTAVSSMDDPGEPALRSAAMRSSSADFGLADRMCRCVGALASSTATAYPSPSPPPSPPLPSGGPPPPPPAPHPLGGKLTCRKWRRTTVEDGPSGPSKL